MDQPRHVSVERDGPVETLTMAAPPLNFISHALLVELYRELVRIRDDESVRALVVTGGISGSFLTHFDVESSLGQAQLAKKRSRFWGRRLAGMTCWALRKANQHSWVDRLLDWYLSRRSAVEHSGYLWVRCLDILDTMPKPVIAAINGVCLGGGCELALRCDFRLMGTGDMCRIGLPEVLVGLVPGGSGTMVRLPRIVGEAEALAVMMTGGIYGPEEAAAIGLVHQVVEAPELMGTARRLAERLSRPSPVAMAGLRDAVRRGSRLPMASARAVDLWALNTAMASDDVEAGLRWYIDHVVAGPDRPDLEALLAQVKAVAELGAVPVEFKGT